VVKLERLKPGETEIQNGFVQVYKYNQETGKMAGYGGRKRLYPPPANHIRQCLQFTWDQVLRNSAAFGIQYPQYSQYHFSISKAKPTTSICTENIDDSEQPPPLYLENLRAILNENIARHLAFKHGDEQDSEKE